MNVRFVIAQIARDREVGLPEILDQDVAIFETKRTIKGLVVEKPVPRQGWTAECSVADEDVVRSEIDPLGVDAAREGGHHRGSCARPPEKVELAAGFRERLVDADVSAAERSPAT